MTKIKLILASSSPQRKKLLETIGISPDEIVPANIDETPLKREKPKDFAIRMAREKAFSVAKENLNNFILSGDTIVATGQRIIGKPSSKNEAKQFLKLLSGRRHRVLSAFTLIKPDYSEITKVVVSRVKFSRLSDKELNEYLDTNEWQGKAGGYAIQGRASAFVPWISGSYTGVMGFPMNEIKNSLISSGWKK